MCNILSPSKEGKWIVVLQRLRKCELCDEWFVDKKSLLFHKFTHDKSLAQNNFFSEESDYEESPKSKNTCTECKKSFITNGSLNIHNEILHKSDTSGCKLCEPIKEEQMISKKKAKIQCEFCLK